MDNALFDKNKQKAFALIRRRLQDNNIRLDVANDIRYETPPREVGGYVCRLELECPVRDGAMACLAIHFSINEGTLSDIGSALWSLDLIYQDHKSLWFAEREEDELYHGPAPATERPLPKDEMEIGEMRMLAILDKLIEFYLQAT